MSSGALAEAPRLREFERVNRSKAVSEARRHSARVIFFKRAIVIGSILGIGGLAVVSLIDPFSGIPANVSIASTSLNGTKITMELPKLNGYRKDGKPYEVRARAGVQDVRTPKLIELTEVEARIQLEESNVVNVIAPNGLFDTGADKLKLTTAREGERITLKSTSGFVVVLKSADVNLKLGLLDSEQDVIVNMPNGNISSDQVSVTESGKLITFTGNVKSLFRSRDGETESQAD